jgi:hypothetical protein
MPKELSYKELFPNLNDLTLRNVVQTETGWVVEAEGASSACCPSCGVASHSVLVGTGVGYETCRCKEYLSPSIYNWAAGVAAAATLCVISLSSAWRAS